MQREQLADPAAGEGAGYKKTVREIAPGTAHTAGGRIREMRGIQNGVIVHALREQALARGAVCGGILVGEERNVRPYELNRVVNDVAHEHRPRSAALGVHDDAAGRM